MLNKTIIMGRLAHTPELKHTTSGTTYTQFSLAVDRDFKDKQSGEKVTDWIDLVAWSHTAEFICQYFAKGRMMIAAGRLQTENYTDKNGNKRKSTKVVVENAYFGDSKRDGDQGNQSNQSNQSDQNNQQSGQSNSAPVYADQFAPLEDDDSELPF